MGRKEQVTRKWEGPVVAIQKTWDFGDPALVIFCPDNVLRSFFVKDTPWAEVEKLQGKRVVVWADNGVVRAFEVKGTQQGG